MRPQDKQTSNGTTYESEYMRKADPRTGWQKFRDWMYNPSKGTVLDRTAKQWGIIGLFYFLFYSVLALLCAICFWGLMSTIDKDRPSYTLGSSLIGTNPGLGFRPISNDTTERSLIWFDPKNETTVKKWTALLNTFFDPYVNRSKLIDGGQNQMHCSYTQSPVNGKVCKVELDKDYGNCTAKESYGYKNSQPCVFIKLNRIFDWVPEYYNDPNNLPEQMPEDLKEHIRKVDKAKLNTIWISCKGEDPRANETIGPLRYFPESRGFPGYYYPYTNQREYASPVVAVQFRKPELNEVIRVECRAWAKNIVYKTDKGEKSGAVHFEIMVDPLKDENNKTVTVDRSTKNYV